MVLSGAEAGRVVAAVNGQAPCCRMHWKGCTPQARQVCGASHGVKCRVRCCRYMLTWAAACTEGARARRCHGGRACKPTHHMHCVPCGPAPPPQDGRAARAAQGRPSGGGPPGGVCGVCVRVMGVGTCMGKCMGMHLHRMCSIVA